MKMKTKTKREINSKRNAMRHRSPTTAIKGGRKFSWSKVLMYGGEKTIRRSACGWRSVQEGPCAGVHLAVYGPDCLGSKASRLVYFFFFLFLFFSPFLSFFIRRLWSVVEMCDQDWLGTKAGWKWVGMGRDSCGGGLRMEVMTVPGLWPDMVTGVEDGVLPLKIH